MTIEEFAILLEVAEGANIEIEGEPDGEECSQPGSQYLH